MQAKEVWATLLLALAMIGVIAITGTLLSKTLVESLRASSILRWAVLGVQVLVVAYITTKAFMQSQGTINSRVLMQVLVAAGLVIMLYAAKPEVLPPVMSIVLP